MATINGTTGADVINDTSSDDVINTLGNNSQSTQDVVNLSGGNDVINLGSNPGPSTEIRVNASSQNLITVNGDNGVVHVGANSLVNQIKVNANNGAVLTAKGVGGATLHDMGDPATDGSWVGNPLDTQSGYFSGKADSVDVDLRNVAPDRLQNVAMLSSSWLPSGVSEIKSISAEFGAAGGVIGANLDGAQSITLRGGAGIAATADNYIDFDARFGNAPLPSINADFSATKQDVELNLSGGGAAGGNSTLVFNGSHGENFFYGYNMTFSSATITTNSKNDVLMLPMTPAGMANINSGAGDDYVNVNGGTATIVTGEGNDIVNGLDVAASIQAGTGSDGVVVDYSSWTMTGAAQTIDMGASGAAQSGNVSFRINAYSSLVNGVGAHASVYAGGTKIGEFQSNNTASTGQDFVVTTAAANLTNGELAVVFDNDAFIAATSTTAARDRNLYVREVEMTNPDGSKQMLWNKAISTDTNATRPVYDRTNAGAPAGVNSAFDGQNTYAYTPNSAGTIGMAWSGALKFNLDTQVAGIDIADAGNGSDTYLFNRGSGKDLYRDSGTGTSDVDTLKFSDDVNTSQIWLSRDAEAKIHVGIIGTANDAVINGIDQLQAGGKTLAAADFDKLINAMASLTPPPMGQLDLNATQLQKLDTVLAANWH